MGYINEHWNFFQQILNLLEHHLGSNSEIVLHDMSLPYEHSIADIRNGHITGRKKGGCTTNLGLELMSGTVEKGDHYNYITYTKSSKTLRSSSMHILDENGNYVGAICINTDITETIKMEEFFKTYNSTQNLVNFGHPAGKEDGLATANEFFSNDIQDLLEQMLIRAVNLTGKKVDEMKKADKLKVLEFLEKRGAFLISKSGNRVCDYLHISKFTLYKYLEIVRGPAKNTKSDTTQNKK